jgi:type VI secretion system protein ImpG
VQSAFYTLRREPRLLSGRQLQNGARSSYVGSETFIALVDANDAPYPTTLRQLGLRVLCTNRDLPLHMPVGKSYTDFTLDTDAPVASIRCIAGPTRPRAPTATGETAWRLISHLQLNYLSLFNESRDDNGSKDGNDEGEQNAAALREMLGLYRDEFDAAARRRIEGIKQVARTDHLRARARNHTDVQRRSLRRQQRVFARVGSPAFFRALRLAEFVHGDRLAHLRT